MADELQLENAVELVDRLKTAVEEFAAREEELERDYHLGTHRGKERYDEESEKLNTTLEDALEGAENAYKAEKKRLKVRFEGRRDRIDRGHKASKNRLQRNLAEQEGHRVYDLQMAMMQTNREVVAGRERAYKVNADFNEQFEPDQEAFESIQKDTRKAFRGYGSFVKRLDSLKEKEIGGLDLSQDEYQLSEIFHQLVQSLKRDVARFKKKNPLAAMFSALPLVAWIVLVAILGGGALWLANQSGAGQDLTVKILSGTGGGILLVVLLYAMGMSAANKGARALSLSLEKARRLHEACLKHSEDRLKSTLSALDQAKEETTSEFDEARKQTPEEAAQMKDSLNQALDDQKERALAKNRELFDAAKEQFEAAHAEKVANLKSDTKTRLAELSESLEGGKGKLATGYEVNWEKLASEWKETIEPIYETVAAVQQKAGALFPSWDPDNWKDWTPPETFAHGARFGEYHVDVSKLCEAMPESEKLQLPGPARFALPLSLTYPEQGSILLETKQSGRETMIEALNTLMLRLLSVAPAGKLSFTLIDPVGLGESFSGIMHLADYDESLINNRIWTQTQQIEQRLADLNEHMEKVIQMYLRNEYANITEYNKQAGDIAEKYHFIVVADFPANFSDIAAKRLMSIISSGSRCGVYSLIHWDKRKTTPSDFMPDELRENSVRVVSKGDHGFAVSGELIDGAEVVLDAPPADEFSTQFIHRIGELSKDAYRVEVPFTAIAPDESELWSSETTRELQVPIGRTGATKFQYLSIGRDTKQHALIAGKTGSGKSTLFHVMITNLALWCSPDQVEFYLVDFKKGVEFKSYANARLPHAKVIAIESDREFGLSVLQRVDEELKRRGDIYRKMGVQDVAGYKEAGGEDPMPRVLLLIDEFQELFVEDDRISQDAAVLMDRIVRQGRAFGIHVILGSQTLGGAYTLARTTLGQMVIRIALQCNEADAYLIMDDSNPAPRLLSRPGEGIYNDSAGMIEGNSPFQVVWLPEAVRVEMLDRVRSRADEDNGRYPNPIVFEGNAPADIHENDLLASLLGAEELAEPARAARIWLGAPNSIKGPTEAVFKRQAGNNLLIVGQRDEAALAILSLSLVCLGAQFPRGKARFILFDGTAPDTPQRDYIDKITGVVPHNIERPLVHDIAELMNELVSEMDARSSRHHEEDEPIFIVIHDLQKYKKLRYEEDFSFSLDDDAGADPGTQLDKLINEGASHGIHVIASCDTLNNINRSLSRKALSEFEMRVVFQMSANDSASLIDSPKAGNLGLHRALFYNEQEGYLETFRPYAIPDNEWIEETGKHLDQLLGYQVS